jgi:predicted N-acyltransferase
MGLPRVEAGAQGEHKIQRGYLPSLTHSSHYIRDPDFRGAVSHVRFVACDSTTCAACTWHSMLACSALHLTPGRTCYGTPSS